MTLAGWCRVLLVTFVFSRTLATLTHHPVQHYQRSQDPNPAGWTDGRTDTKDGVFLRQTRKHARPMFYIKCGYRNLCYCYSKITRHHYCCSCDVGACFPAHAHAITPTGERTPMHTLRTGDDVLAVNSAGKIVSSRVLGFLDRRPKEISLYLTLHTDAGHNLTLSPNHVLFRANHNTTEPISVFGSDVKVGDVIFSANHSAGRLESSVVIGLEHRVMEGAYVPLTKEGTLLVDDIFVSCYASYKHSLAHRFLSPARAIPSILRFRPNLFAHILTYTNIMLNKIIGFDLGFEMDYYDMEDEGEAYIVSIVKVIGRVWYRSEGANRVVVQIRPTTPPDGILGSLPFSGTANSLIQLARSW